MKDKFFIGIDPGFQGGISVIRNGVVELVVDIPIKSTSTGKKKMNISKMKREEIFIREVDTVKLRDIINVYAVEKTEVLIEKVASMPGQGVFTFGYNYGLVVASVQNSNFNLHKVSPRKWKTYYNLDSDKGKSISLVREMYPESKDCIKLKKHDGRAESLLLADYLFKHTKEFGIVE